MEGKVRLEKGGLVDNLVLGKNTEWQEAVSGGDMNLGKGRDVKEAIEEKMVRRIEN
jgi:hypothetical protein